jgi:ATP-dependent Clp protease ATP-binding subunit ClpC
MAGMERFTQRARRVLSLAHQEAERARNSNIGTEYLLLGLIDEEGGVAGRVLRELGMTPEHMREVVNRVTSSPASFDPNHVELVADTQQALENSVYEARRLGHHYIGTEHILLGLVRVKGAAIEVLRRLGITAVQIQRQTRRVLNETTSPSPMPAKQETPTLDRFTDNLISHAEIFEYGFLAGRPDVLKQVIHILLQRNQKNPMIVGQPGIGKTSIVQCLANSIVNGDVPVSLLNTRILSLNIYKIL